MRLLFTLILLIVIPVTYFVVNRVLENKVVETKEYEVNFSEDRSGVKKLDSIQSYNSIIQRPLFIESRELEKKIEKKKKKKLKPVVEDLKVQALGIALSSEGVLAVIKDLRNGKIVRLRINENIYGWTLQSVSEGNFVFLKNKQKKVINFKK